MNAYERLREHPDENAYLLAEKIDEIKTVAAMLFDPQFQSAFDVWLKAEKDAIAKAKEDFRFHFGLQLKQLFDKENMKIRGQYPLLRVGLFTLKLNFEFGEAILFFGPEVEKLKSKIPLQLDKIYSIIRQYDQDMRNKDFDAQRVLDTLHRAYERCLGIAGKPAGEKLRITLVLKEYVFLMQPKQFNVDPTRGHYREYSRPKLSYMLYQLKLSDIDARGMRLHVATFDSTVDKLRSFWIPDNEEGEGTHYEYISFEPAKE